MTNKQVALILAVIVKHLSKYNTGTDIYRFADELLEWLCK